jgi:hypothetical protein
MTVAFTHVVPINGQEAGDSTRLAFDAIWDALLHKAENPVRFVPNILDCRVVERYSDGFMREALFRMFDRQAWVRERVTPQKDQRRIVFEMIGHPHLAAVHNEVGQDEQGRFTFTLTYVVSNPAEMTSDLLCSYDQRVRETAEQTVRTLRETARPTC